MTKTQQERVRTALEKYTRKATASAKVARETLIREGIYLENGNLAPNYVEEKKMAS